MIMNGSSYNEFMCTNEHTEGQWVSKVEKKLSEILTKFFNYLLQNNLPLHAK